MSGEGEGFLSRWSRRKRGAAEEEKPPEAGPAEPANDAPAPAPPLARCRTCRRSTSPACRASRT
jgi:hypothetical protein